MQAVDVRGELGAVRGFGGRPVAQGGLRGFAVSQTMRDGEAGVSFQLGEHHQNLPGGATRRRKAETRDRSEKEMQTKSGEY